MAMDGFANRAALSLVSKISFLGGLFANRAALSLIFKIRFLGGLWPWVC